MRKGLKDLTGLRFGKLVVVELTTEKSDATNSRYWLCQCDCGGTTILTTAVLNSGNTSSCGCGRGQKGMSPGESGFNCLLNNYRMRGNRSTPGFTLTRDQFRGLVSSACHYCGALPSFVSKARSKRSSEKGVKRSEFLFNGIDRVDSGLGYTPENCVPCCWNCNRAKATLKQDDFLCWLEAAYEHQMEPFIDRYDGDYGYSEWRD